MRAFRLTIAALMLGLLGAAIAPTPSASAATAEDYDITIRHDLELDEVFGTAKDVGGTWVITLEWRKGAKKKWTPLAQSDVQKGKGKAFVGNVVRGEDFDFTGLWRACVKKGKTKTCGEKLLVE